MKKTIKNNLIVVHVYNINKECYDDCSGLLILVTWLLLYAYYPESILLVLTNKTPIGIPILII